MDEYHSNDSDIDRDRDSNSDSDSDTDIQNNEVENISPPSLSGSSSSFFVTPKDKSSNSGATAHPSNNPNQFSNI